MRLACGQSPQLLFRPFVTPLRLGSPPTPVHRLDFSSTYKATCCRRSQVGSARVGCDALEWMGFLSYVVTVRSYRGWSRPTLPSKCCRPTSRCRTWHTA